MVVELVKKVIKKERKFNVDGTDRSILRAIHNTRRSFSSSEIAKKVGYTSSGIRQRLDKLKKQGIIKTSHIGGIRSFKRTFINPQTKKSVTRIIRAPRSIKWKIDLKRSKKK